mgnify:CR=1 FL=1
MPHFDNETLHQILPDLKKIPVLKFISNRLYFLLDARSKDQCTLELELMQVGFDRQAGECFPMRPFRQEEESITLADGTRWPKRFRKVDWRYEEPEVIVAVQKLLPEVTTYKTRQMTQKMTTWFTRENVHTAGRKMFFMGPATTPENPEIETDPKPSMIVSSKPW